MYNNLFSLSMQSLSNYFLTVREFVIRSFPLFFQVQVFPPGISCRLSVPLTHRRTRHDNTCPSVSLSLSLLIKGVLGEVKQVRQGVIITITTLIIFFLVLTGIIIKVLLVVFALGNFKCYIRVLLSCLLIYLLFLRTFALFNFQVASIFLFSNTKCNNNKGLLVLFLFDKELKTLQHQERSKICVPNYYRH